MMSRVKRWWHPASNPSGQGVPFEVRCICGQLVRGQRQRRAQTIPCLGCSAPIFVLGTSPLPDPGTSLKKKPLGPTPSALRGPLLAGAITLALVLPLCVLLIVWLTPPRASTDLPPDDEVRQCVETARLALTEEKFQAAVRELTRARALLPQAQGKLTPLEAREVVQLHRQAALLADLLHESLNQVLQLVAGLRDEERQAQLERRYGGQAVLIDDVVRRDAAGSHHLAVLEIRAPGEPARLDLDGLKLFRTLPLREPQRLVFGARLAEVAREPPGRWVIRFDPESTVLLTDETVAGACCPQPLDEELREVIRRQAEWINQGP